MDEKFTIEVGRTYVLLKKVKQMWFVCLIAFFHLEHWDLNLRFQGAGDIYAVKMLGHIKQFIKM